MKKAIKYAMDKLFAEDGLGEKKEAEKVAESKSWLGGKAKKTLMIFAMEFVIAIVILGIIQLFNL